MFIWILRLVHGMQSHALSQRCQWMVISRLPEFHLLLAKLLLQYLIPMMVDPYAPTGGSYLCVFKMALLKGPLRYLPLPPHAIPLMLQSPRIRRL